MLFSVQFDGGRKATLKLQPWNRQRLVMAYEQEFSAELRFL